MSASSEMSASSDRPRRPSASELSEMSEMSASSDRPRPPSVLAGPPAVTIAIRTDPPEAKVRIGEELHDSGTIVLAGAREGQEVEIAVEKGGYATAHDTLVLKEGLEKSYRLGEEGHIRIYLEPAKAELTVNGKKGKRTVREGEYVFSGSMDEPVTLVAALAGYETKTVETRIKRKIDSTTIRLKPLSPGTGDLTPKAAAEADEFGTLDINAKPYADVQVGKERWGTTHIERNVRPGTYRVVLSHPGSGRQHVCTSKVLPGKKTRCFYDFTLEAK
jgi:ribosomal protein S5